MGKGDLISRMLLLCTNKHHGQFDKQGKPYILHPLAVMELLKTNDEELQCIALGHDLVEDCKDVSFEMLTTEFTPRISDGIRALTKMPGETFEQYKARVMANRDAVRVKLADITHNTDIRRLKGVSDKDIERMAKYQRFYVELAQLL